jgi:hypothetical protein
MKKYITKNPHIKQKKKNFKNNFKPSTMGTNKPNINKLGPQRKWQMANNLRSQRLIKPNKKHKTKKNKIIKNKQSKKNIKKKKQENKKKIN